MLYWKHHTNLIDYNCRCMCFFMLKMHTLFLHTLVVCKSKSLCGSNGVMRFMCIASAMHFFYCLIRLNYYFRGELKMKKKICILLTFVMIFSLLCGCSAAMSNDPNETTLSTTESTTYEVITSIESTSESTTEQITTTTSIVQTTKKQTKASTTKRITETQKQTTTEKTTAAATSGCENGNHSMNCGNIGRWFNSRSEVENHWKQIDTKYFSQYESGIMSYEEYSKKSPYGYECWSCSHCGKWTGNFKYR